MDDDEFSSFWACVNLTDFPSSTDLGAYIVDHSSFGPIGGNLDSELSVGNIFSSAIAARGCVYKNNCVLKYCHTTFLSFKLPYVPSH